MSEPREEDPVLDTALITMLVLCAVLAAVSVLAIPELPHIPDDIEIEVH